MGNRALRRQLSEMIGVRIYTGFSKIAALEYFPARKLRRLLVLASVRPGDLVQDCDGFNHRVTKVNLVWDNGSWKERNVKGRYLSDIQFEFEDGHVPCGCGADRTPSSVAEIEEFWSEWIPYQRHNGFGWADGPFYDEILRRLSSKESICDKDGIMLPELRKLMQVVGR